MFQKTIKKPISFSGIGLHTGKNANITFKPAPVNTGIVFICQNKEVKLTIENITHTARYIAIGNKKNTIMTVEHLTAGLYISGICNLYIEIDNNEIPVMDESALSFVKLIRKCGIVIQKKVIIQKSLLKPVKLLEKDKFIIALPSKQLKITYAIDFDHPDLKNQSIHFDNITPEIFEKQIAPARTFGFQKEVDSLYKKGLALGGNLQNAVVLTDKGYLNKKLRFKDECIRHKVLDFIGVLAFLNQPINAHFIIYRSGHKFDIRFIKGISNNLTG